LEAKRCNGFHDFFFSSYALIFVSNFKNIFYS